MSIAGSSLSMRKLKEQLLPPRTDKDPLQRGASTVKVERSAASNTFTARSER
jgi:hypothetical protein